MADPSDAGFGIQTAARRTGISTHTLRVWEQRYGALRIARSPAGRRRYTPADLDRLRLLKRLVDCGERISRIGGLSDEQLQSRLADLGLASAQAPGTSLRIAAWGESLPLRLSQLPLDLQLVATSSSLEDFVAQCLRASPQSALIKVDNLSARKLALLTRLRRSLPDVTIGIIYGFARRRDVEQLRAACDTLHRAPADLQAVVERLIQLRGPADEKPATPAPVAPEPAATTAIPARRFTRRQLDFLAARQTHIDCECPAHLVELVRTLLAFERYSAGCAQDQPTEAALHRMLLETTAQSRRRFEDALAEVAAHEGIEIPD